MSHMLLGPTASSRKKGPSQPFSLDPIPGAPRLVVRTGLLKVNGIPGRVLGSGISTNVGFTPHWWDADPGGVVTDSNGVQVVTWLDWWMPGFTAGEALFTESRNNPGIPTPLTPAVAPGGFMLSIYNWRSAIFPTPGHTYTWSGDQVSGDYRAAWSLGPPTTTSWGANRYHVQAAIALNPAFPSGVLFTDTFDRPSGNLHGSMIESGGQAWFVSDDAGATITINSGKTIKKSGALNRHAIASVDVGSVNMRTTVTVGGQTTGPGVRTDKNFANGYFFWRNGTSGYLIMRRAGVQTTLAQANLSVNGVYSLSATEEVGGTRLAVTVDGGLFMNHLDNTAGRPMTTRAGVIMYTNDIPAASFSAETL